MKHRHVVIGAGATLFGAHRPALALPTAELVAVCDPEPARGHPGGQASGHPGA
jgi:predicted dehydrogenase